MNVATMLAELKGAAKFVDAQRAAGDTAADLEDNMSDGLSDKISRLRNLTTEQGATLTGAVTAGPWPAPQREKLAKAIRTAVYGNQKAKDCRDNQEAMVELFFSSIRLGCDNGQDWNNVLQHRKDSQVSREHGPHLAARAIDRPYGELIAAERFVRPRRMVRRRMEETPRSRQEVA